MSGFSASTGGRKINSIFSCRCLLFISVNARTQWQFHYYNSQHICIQHRSTLVISDVDHNTQCLVDSAAETICRKRTRCAYYVIKTTRPFTPDSLDDHK